MTELQEIQQNIDMLTGALKGIGVRDVAKAFNEMTPGVNWSSCTKTYMITWWARAHVYRTNGYHNLYNFSLEEVVERVSAARTKRQAKLAVKRPLTAPPQPKIMNAVEARAVAMVLHHCKATTKPRDGSDLAHAFRVVERFLHNEFGL